MFQRLVCLRAINMACSLCICAVGQAIFVVAMGWKVSCWPVCC